MLKKTIKYEDFNGNKREEDFYFNMTKTELTKLATKYNGTLQATLARYVQTQNYKGMQEIFDDFIDSSYGIKSDDGRRFMKDPEYIKAFRETNAYDQLFLELSDKPENFQNFIIGIVPTEVADEINKEMAKRDTELPA